MRLIDLANNYNSLLYKLEQDDEFDLEAELNTTGDALEEKLEACGWMFRNLEAEEIAYATEAKRLKSKADSRARAAQRLKDYIAFCLKGQPQKTKNFNFTFRQSEQVEILDPESLPECYQRVKTIIEPNKELIKQDLKNGATINGVGLLRNYNLQIK